jgi:hypothetical protein
MKRIYDLMILGELDTEDPEFLATIIKDMLKLQIKLMDQVDEQRINIKMLEEYTANANANANANSNANANANANDTMGFIYGLGVFVIIYAVSGLF